MEIFFVYFCCSSQKSFINDGMVSFVFEMIEIKSSFKDERTSTDVCISFSNCKTCSFSALFSIRKLLSSNRIHSVEVCDRGALFAAGLVSNTIFLFSALFNFFSCIQQFSHIPSSLHHKVQFRARW